MIGPSIALLLWLLTAGLVLGALAGGAFAAITRRPAWIPWIAGAAFVWLAAYGALLIGVSLAGEEQILEYGEVESFCGVYLDCHMGVEVAGVRKAEALGSAALSTRGNFWVVTVRVSNTARRVPLRIHAPVARVIDDTGRKYGPSDQGQRALAGPAGPPVALDREVAAGGAYSAEIVFDLPLEVHDPRLVITSDVWVDRATELFLIGDVDSFLHPPAVHRLVRGTRPDSRGVAGNEKASSYPSMVRPLESSLGAFGEQRLLAGVYIARLSIAAALAVAATVVHTTAEDSASTLPLVLFVVGIPTVWTSVSVLYARYRSIGPRFLAAQVVHDLLLTTTAILLTGGVGSEFALIYVLLIGVAGLLLGFRGAMVTAVACAGVYLGIAFWQISTVPAASDGTMALPNLSGGLTAILWGLALGAAVFLLVGVASGVAGRRLRAQREQLEELEEELARARIDAQDILNTIESGILSIDAAEEIDFVNVTARTQLGISGLPSMEMRDRSEPRGLVTLYNELVQTLRTEREVEYAEFALPDVDGNSRAFSVTTTVLYDPRGSKRGAAAIVRDVEYVKRMEDLARQADRLRSVNELAAGLAHEIQNPLAAIRSAVELLATGDRNGIPEDARLMDLIVRETDRVSSLIGDFKAFSRMTIRRRERVDLVAVVEDALEVERITAGDGAPRAVFTRPGVSYPVEVDRNLLKQVCLNLLENARVAVEGVRNARIEVRVTGQALPELERAGAFVALEVRDNGVGIDPEVRDRIFDPFFTTRVTGFGMGLAVVHRIVDLHGGMVWVESVPGKGSVFRVAIPLAP